MHSDSITDHPASGKKKALLIAVEYNMVKDYHKLVNAKPNARDLKRLLIEDFEYPEGDTVLMMDDKSVTKELWPTKTGIQKQIRRFVQGASAGDHLFFYYSGHSHQVPCNHHTESDGLDEVIYTCNKTEIMDNDLKKWLVNPLPYGCKLFALWDSCHSQTILDLDHYICNEPEGERHIPQFRESGSQPMLRRARQKYFRKNGVIPRSAFTIASHELRGRPATRASVSLAAVSAGNSPPFSKWAPLCVDLRRVLSPLSMFKCNGKCPLPTEGDKKHAHVISLSACRDNESAFDDACSGTFTQFFIDHLRANPKSTLRELLLAIRQRVDNITDARQELDKETSVVSRRSTFASDRRIKTLWTPQVIRRGTEVNVGTPEKLYQLMPPSVQYNNKKKYSQKPGYSSHYRLNLDELIDL